MTQHGARLLKKWTRTIHIYLSLFALLSILFFALTGFMLNHSDWFGLTGTSVRVVEGTVATPLLAQPDRLGVVETLRRDFGVSGAMDSFEIEEDELRVAFRAPARQADAVIRRADGATEVTLASRGMAARVAELHRGADASAAWRVVIDVTAGLMLVSSLSGLYLWTLVPKWRPFGLLALSLCLLLCLAVYFLFEG